jgi:ribosome recycling factor
MTPEETLKDAEQRMKHAVEVMLDDFKTYRTGRANPGVLERIKIDYYGVDTPITQVASISVPEPRQLLITPYDKNSLGAIEKTILKSDLGINPSNDGTNLRLLFPPMTEERRRELVKQVNSRAEQGCVAIRNVRHHALEHLRAAQRDKQIGEDQEKTFEQQLQKLTDKFIAEVHDHQKNKDAELMEV